MSERGVLATRVVLLGAGSMGYTHARAYANIAGVSVVAVVGRDQDAARRLAAPLGAAVYGDLDAALAAHQPDVVDCCLPTPWHRAAVEAAAACGCHVICEKPMALTQSDAADMIEVCRSHGVHLLMAHVVRFFPAYRRLAAALEAGAIGTPVTCTLVRQGFYPGGHEAWYHDDARSGGVFLDMMIHDFDWALQRFGPAERVYARLVRRGATFAQGMATIRHRSGVLSHITGTWGFPGSLTTTVEIAGTGGLLAYRSDKAPPLRLLATPATTVPGAVQDVPLPDLSAGEDPYHTQLAHFIDVIAGRSAPLVQPEEALDAVRLALAARASAVTNRVQALEEETR